MNIIVNGKPFTMDKGKDQITYELLAEIAGHDFRHNPTITYRGKKRSGMLFSGEVLLVCDGMIINCADTIDA